MQNGVQSLWLNSVFCYPTILHLQNCGQTVLLMRPTSPFLLYVCYGIMMTYSTWQRQNTKSLIIWHSNPANLEVALVLALCNNDA